MTIDYKAEADRLAEQLHMLCRAWDVCFVSESGLRRAREVLRRYREKTTPTDLQEDIFKRKP